MKPVYTPWTIPQSAWTPVLPGVVITPELECELIRFVRDFDDTELKNRLKTFENNTWR